MYAARCLRDSHIMQHLQVATSWLLVSLTCCLHLRSLRKAMQERKQDLVKKEVEGKVLEVPENQCYGQWRNVEDSWWLDIFGVFWGCAYWFGQIWGCTLWFSWDFYNIHNPGAQNLNEPTMVGSQEIVPWTSLNIPCCYPTEEDKVWCKWWKSPTFLRNIVKVPQRVNIHSSQQRGVSQSCQSSSPFRERSMSSTNHLVPRPAGVIRLT